MRPCMRTVFTLHPPHVTLEGCSYPFLKLWLWFFHCDVHEWVRLENVWTCSQLWGLGGWNLKLGSFLELDGYARVGKMPFSVSHSNSDVYSPSRNLWPFAGSTKARFSSNFPSQAMFMCLDLGLINTCTGVNEIKAAWKPTGVYRCVFMATLE